MIETIKRHGSIVALAVMSVTLAVLPAPWCFDCEGPNPFGVDVSVIAHREHLTGAICASVVLLAGLLEFRWSWIIPPGFVIADIITQHLAGVPWWSLRYNEGPILIFFDLIEGFILLTFGYLLRKCFEWLRSHTPQSRVR
jgi:hypothetical protein